MTPPSVYWALWSKLPGDADDYRLLACSDGCAPKFEQLLRVDRPSTPTTTQEGRTDSLPWVTIGVADEGQVLLSVMSWTDAADVGSRAIAASRMFLGDFGAMFATVGFLTAYRSVAALELPPDGASRELALDRSLGGEPVPDLPPWVVPAWAARVAALLLDERVVVIDGDGLDVEARLAVVDAVAVLLPAGYRYWLTAASWASRPDRRPQRLCFGAEGGTEAVEVRPDAVPEPRTAEAKGYLRELDKWLGRSALPMLLAHLAAATCPVPFEAGAGQALEIVQLLDLPAILLAEIREGRGRPQRILRLFKDADPGVFGPDLGEVYRFLLTRRDIDRVAELAPYPSGELFEAVVWAVRHALDPEDGAYVADGFVERVATGGDREQLLVRLLTTVNGHEATPELRRVGLLTIFRTSKLPALRAALLAEDQLGAGLGLAVECRATYRDELAGLVAWFADGVPQRARPPWLALLHHVATADRDEQPPSRALVEAALRQWPPIIGLAFVLAVGRQRLSTLGPDLWVEVVAAVTQPPDAPLRRVLTRELPPAAPTAKDPRSQAWVDVALLASGQAPQAVSSDPGLAEPYVVGWDAALTVLPPPVAEELAPRMPGAVVDALLARDGAARTGRAAAVVIGAVIRHPTWWRAQEIGGTVARLLTGPDGARLLPVVAERAGARWVTLVREDPDLRRTIPRLELRETANTAASPEKLAEPWATLVSIEGIVTSSKRVDFAEIRGWRPAKEPGAILHLVDATTALLHERSHAPAAMVDDWRTQTLRAVVRREALGPAAAEGTKTALAAAARRAEDDRQRRLEALAARGEQLRQELIDVKLERRSVRDERKGIRLRLAALVGPAAAGVPWWSWRRWWPSR